MSQEQVRNQREVLIATMRESRADEPASETLALTRVVRLARKSLSCFHLSGSSPNGCWSSSRAAAANAPIAKPTPKIASQDTTASIDRMPAPAICEAGPGRRAHTPAANSQIGARAERRGRQHGSPFSQSRASRANCVARDHSAYVFAIGPIWTAFLVCGLVDQPSQAPSRGNPAARAGRAHCLSGARRYQRQVRFALAAPLNIESKRGQP